MAARNLKFGIAMIVLGGLLLAYISTGLLNPAPSILIFALSGSIGAVGLGIWSLLGKY